MSIRLSCADYTWPSVPHRVALDIVAALEFDAVDLGYFEGRSHVRPDEVGDDVELWAGQIRERCAGRGLEVADVFAQTSDFSDRAVNHPDAGEQERSERFFTAALTFARLAGSPGMTILPGIVFDDEPFDTSLARAADGLRKRVDEAAAADMRLSIEPHQGSLVDTPEKTAHLLQAVPGLTLTLDYGHFTFGGSADADIEPLLPSAGHVQCRGGAPGVLQAASAGNTIDFARMVDGLVAAGYDGYLATEYVWADWHRCNEVDNLTETVALRDLLRSALGA